MNPIEKRFINRETSPEDEASLMANLSVERWQVLCRQRDRRDLEKQWQAIELAGPAVVTRLRLFSGNADVPDTTRVVTDGLAMLIEEIHHLNACSALRRREGGR